MGRGFQRHHTKSHLSGDMQTGLLEFFSTEPETKESYKTATSAASSTQSHVDAPNRVSALCHLNILSTEPRARRPCIDLYLNPFGKLYKVTRVIGNERNCVTRMKMSRSMSQRQRIPGWWQVKFPRLFFLSRGKDVFKRTARLSCHGQCTPRRGRERQL